MNRLKLRRPKAKGGRFPRQSLPGLKARPEAATKRRGPGRPKKAETLGKKGRQKAAEVAPALAVRAYEPKDLEAVNAVTAQWGVEKAKAGDFNGVAVVAEKGDKIVGFAWAGVMPNGTAVIDNFCISKAETSDGKGLKPNRVGLALYNGLLMAMMTVTGGNGQPAVKKIIYVVPSWNRPLLRVVLRLVGADGYVGLFHVFKVGA